MGEKNSFLNWVGFKGEEEQAPSSVERIRELESQLADLKSRRDITSLSKEEFEILATETAMSMIKSAQLREAKAQAAADRLVKETSRTAKETLESVDLKARSILSGAESRGRKYIQVAEAEASELLSRTESEADSLLESKRREAAALATAARREGERIISSATGEIANYRDWLAGVMGEAERLYKIQTQSLDAAENAIHQSRTRLQSAFVRLSELQESVLNNLNDDNTLINSGPISVKSERTKAAISAPAKKRTAKKRATKKTISKRK
jgi:hypothetical protein